jgi:hypothetical protein
LNCCTASRWPTTNSLAEKRGAPGMRDRCILAPKASPTCHKSRPRQSDLPSSSSARDDLRIGYDTAERRAKISVRFAAKQPKSRCSAGQLRSLRIAPAERIALSGASTRGFPLSGGFLAVANCSRPCLRSRSREGGLSCAGILWWLLMCYLALFGFCRGAVKCLKLWWVCKDSNLGPAD